MCVSGTKKFVPVYRFTYFLWVSFVGLFWNSAKSREFRTNQLNLTGAGMPSAKSLLGAYKGKDRNGSETERTRRWLEVQVVCARVCWRETEREISLSRDYKLQQADPAAPGVCCHDTHDNLYVRIAWLYMYLHVLLTYVLQCVAVCCSVLQRVAAYCSVLQGVAVCCSVLQRIAACYSVLQCVAACSAWQARIALRSS